MNIFNRDVTDTFYKPINQLILPEIKGEAELRMLELDELVTYSQNPKYEISTKAANLVESENIFSYGAFVDGELVAYCYFAINDLEPVLNRAGHPFGGIGIRMPKDVVFQFKGFTLKEHRGKKLLPAILYTGSTSLAGPNGWAFVTTDIKNKAAANMFASINLDKTGIRLTEYRIFNRSIYKMPEYLQLGDPSDENSKQVYLYEPDNS